MFPNVKLGSLYPPQTLTRLSREQKEPNQLTWLSIMDLVILIINLPSNVAIKVTTFWSVCKNSAQFTLEKSENQSCID